MKVEPFDEMVGKVAGKALMRLIRGECWEHIIYFVAEQAILWRAAADKAVPKGGQEA